MLQGAAAGANQTEQNNANNDTERGKGTDGSRVLVQWFDRHLSPTRERSQSTSENLVVHYSAACHYPAPAAGRICVLCANRLRQLLQRSCSLRTSPAIKQVLESTPVHPIAAQEAPSAAQQRQLAQQQQYGGSASARVRLDVEWDEGPKRIIKRTPHVLDLQHRVAKNFIK